MQQYLTSSTDLKKVIKNNNKFLATLEPKQFYNTTLNPLVIADITEETTKGDTVTTKRTYVYAFTAMTTYFTPEDIPKETPRPNYQL